ncbi:endonuclease G, mitochondrial isoform X1 [Bacillus rossius redtenbacheri]|uniref:endonuclease G, mitochondrial isoform X1 n=1 Tax=Bacillus rossius redtenbacheri TaxID=93214 RepID=UPI002FDEF098
MVRKMAFRARVYSISVVVGVGVGGWILGTFTERKRLLQISDKFYDGTHETSSNFCFHKNFPALPLCGTVSAASPIENKVVVSQPSILPASTRVSEIMRYGFPGLDNVRSFDDYVLSYDRRTRVPHWVFEHLTKDKLKYNDAVDRSKCQFYEDESQHIFFRALNTDYKGSGFDRGHMAAAGNHRLHQKHVEQTFVLSNMAPQVGRGFNRDAWNRLEKYVRKLTKKYVNVYVCTGPLYLPRKESDGKTYVKYQVIGANTVAVPTHFFKVVVGEAEDRSLEMEAYVMPNQVIDDNTPLSVFQVPPESIERAAGLLFFDRVSRDKLSAVNGKKK